MLPPALRSDHCHWKACLSGESHQRSSADQNTSQLLLQLHQWEWRNWSAQWSFPTKAQIAAARTALHLFWQPYAWCWPDDWSHHEGLDACWPMILLHWHLLHRRMWRFWFSAPRFWVCLVIFANFPSLKRHWKLVSCQDATFVETEMIHSSKIKAQCCGALCKLSDWFKWKLPLNISCITILITNTILFCLCVS